MKPLAEWFWTDRWDGSSAALLPLEARGLYREMLTQAWRRDGRLPSSPESIKRAVRCTDAEWDRCWPLVKPYWREADGWLTNDTQIEVLVETKRQMEARSNRGAAAARKRWECSSNAQALPKHMLTQSPSNALRSLDPDLSPDQSQTQTTSGGPDPLDEIKRIWNEVATPARLETCRVLNKKRRGMISAGLKTYPDPEFWRRVFTLIAADPMCRGGGSSKWVASIEYPFQGNAVRWIDKALAMDEPQPPPVDDYVPPSVRRQRESDAAVLKALQGELDAGRALSDRDAERYARLTGTGVAS